MKNIAPQIIRKRLLIEAKYTISVDQEIVKKYLTELPSHLNLRVYGEPIIHSPGGAGKEVNQGYDAFIPLIDSGIALYIWSSEKFLSCVLYTCKDFSVEDALTFTQDFFQTTELEHFEF